MNALRQRWDPGGGNFSSAVPNATLVNSWCRESKTPATLRRFWSHLSTFAGVNFRKILSKPEILWIKPKFATCRGRPRASGWCDPAHRGACIHAAAKRARV